MRWPGDTDLLESVALALVTHANTHSSPALNRLGLHKCDARLAKATQQS